MTVAISIAIIVAGVTGGLVLHDSINGPVSGLTATAPQPSQIRTKEIDVSHSKSPSDASVSFTVNVQSGPAPLSVIFTASSVGLDSSYGVDFGDGVSSSLMAGPSCAQGFNCPKIPTGFAAHTYRQPGRYVANLSKGDTLEATITIVVTGH